MHVYLVTAGLWEVIQHHCERGGGSLRDCLQRVDPEIAVQGGKHFHETVHHLLVVTALQNVMHIEQTSA